ncbi:F-box protein FBX9 [Plasmopara halstedii]|uniref:F-box protein FBX9 n=1 Tax=Plasmopara halstedii TaxID=4781 RepID=A0A0P1AYR7_PLAHL|nr:F-box protein FBX9 [Plasmopara halstedii]CEG46985.1 F-box protein FBX9 [Plasmopara halstedii]|eukprot:XP_024583354.1 F-box protein FBX9 [Plasmopara halstedii]
MVSHRRGYSAVKGSSHRDADEEALQIALRESIKPDYLAEILRSEAKQRLLDVARTSVPQVNHKAISNEQLMEIHEQEDSGDEDDTDTRSNARVVKGSVTTDGLQKAEDEKTQVDPNANHTLLNFPDTLLINILQWLDEDTIGSCTCTCKRLLPMARSEVLFESICRRVFPTQNPRVAIAITRNKFGLRRFPTWFAMFHDRPRVRYNGFYWLKVTYYKKPELSMWTDIVPGTILKCIYYRYFAFQRDGTVLYGMLFKAPHEVETHMRDRRKGSKSRS